MKALMDSEYIKFVFTASEDPYELEGEVRIPEDDEFAEESEYDGGDEEPDDNEGNGDAPDDEDLDRERTDQAG